MVKGVTKQAILVKSPDPRLFDEAIFIVKEEALTGGEDSTQEVLRQAREAADGYLRESRQWDRKLKSMPGPWWGAAGAAMASAVWAVIVFLL